MVARRAVIGGMAALGVAGAIPGAARAGGGRVVATHFVVEDGRIWIAAMVNGKGPFFFIVDTGAPVSLIDDAFAKSMHLDMRRGREISGIGGVSSKSWYSADKVVLASGINFPGMMFAGIRQRPSKDAVGTIGVWPFTAHDCDLDFAKGEWRAYLGGRPDVAGLTRLDARFAGAPGAKQIVAKVSLDGFETELLFDTGASDIALLFGRLAARSGLWNAERPYAPVQSAGIGAARLPARLVLVKRLKLAPFVFENVLVKVTDPGSASVRGFDGLVGLGALARLNLSMSAGKGAVYAAPSGLPGTAEAYPLAGLWLEERGGAIVVTDVGTGSPAKAAGLAVGDVLKGGPLPSMIAAIQGPAGKEIDLQVERGGVVRDVRYTLRPWL
jgi:predicted aspartyl protease